MKLRVTSPEQCIFTGTIEKLTLPTEAGEITILPDHQPLTSVVKPGLVRIYSEEAQGQEFIRDNGAITISVSKGLLYVDGQDIVITTAAATSSPEQSLEVLEQMKKDMETELEKIKVDGSVDDVEQAMLNIQKVTADLRLVKLGHVSSS